MSQFLCRLKQAAPCDYEMAIEIPDIYADQFLMSLSAYGVTMAFLSSGAPIAKDQADPPSRILVLRMSLEHAKAMCQIMHTQLRQYEEQVIKCAIALPPQPVQGVSP